MWVSGLPHWAPARNRHLDFLPSLPTSNEFLIQAHRQRLCLRLMRYRGASQDLVAFCIDDLHRGVGEQGDPVSAGQEGAVGDIGRR